MAFWVLASHPSNYRVLDSVLDLDEDWWRTGRSRLRKGDRVAIWKYKGHDRTRGIIALGEVLTNPAVMDMPNEGHPYWVGQGRPLNPIAERVRVRYVRPEGVPLWLEDNPDSVLNELSVARAQGGTAFKLTLEQWRRLLDELGGWPEDGASESTASELERLTREASRGQGFGLTSVQRRAVEKRAMDVTREHYERNTWTVDDVSKKAAYDLRCSHGSTVRRVEVKGTTGSPDSVILTRGEVRVARSDPSGAVLAIVHHIRLRDDNEPEAYGGQLLLLEPWHLADEQLEPLTFRYQVKPTSG